ncbi:PREDICTED: uncharacterized protein LOC109158953 [Ipomoea nil]|uniref:uncharacterized protein LOC109158953 n=1 Tax=Ipomoea nil TaxID=35883 RepID=UPI000900FB37|nr:PREDICTED: uncharacterized protein LOC109158953 [Ipomoea nil]
MAALHLATENGSNTSTPRSYRDDGAAASMQAQPSPPVRLMCSFGGKILPRPFDNQLRYVGGDTRIVAVDRRTNFSSLVAKLSKLSGFGNMCLKYQLPNEDLDALITVTSDEDVENMVEEYDRLLVHAAQKSARLRLFLFPNEADHSTPASAITSILDGSAKSEQWFIDALNCEPVLERGRSEVSSVISDPPDYFFDNLDDRPREFRLKNKKLLHDNVSNSDPGSPAPVVSSPSLTVPPTVTVTVMPDLPPVKTKPVPAVESKETSTGNVSEPVPQQSGYPGSPFSHYSRPQVQPVPVYYVTPGPFQPGNPMPVGAPYIQPQFAARQGQVPVGFSHPVSSIAQFQDGGVGQAKALDNHEMSQRVATDGVNLPMFHGVRNSGIAPSYAAAVAAGGEEMHGRPILERKVVRNSQAS